MVFSTDVDNEAYDSTVMEEYELSNKNTAMMIKDQSTLRNMFCIYSELEEVLLSDLNSWLLLH